MSGTPAYIEEGKCYNSEAQTEHKYAIWYKTQIFMWPGVPIMFVILHVM